MATLLSLVVFGSVALAYAAIAPAPAERLQDQQSTVISDTGSGDLPSLPGAPRGKSTILGGEIRSVDQVLDQFTLRIFGQRPIKILYDERTQVFRDGVRIPLRDLHPEAHASVQTVLDGANVFAVSIHMLSEMPQGECQGHVLSYNPDTRELMVSSSLSREPIRLLVRADTPVVREGQETFTSASSGASDLVNGALVTVDFASDNHGHGVANHITVLAKPGSAFVFSGNISSLDMPAGLLVVVDPRDQRSYQIVFDSARIPATENLHPGDHVRVTASFDGNNYTALEILPNK